MLIFRRTWLSEVVKANIWNCYLVRGGHAATVGTEQGDRCSCGPAQQAGKTIPLISHLIPLSTGPQSQSKTNMLITPVYIRPLVRLGWETNETAVAVSRDPRAKHRRKSRKVGLLKKKQRTNLSIWGLGLKQSLSVFKSRRPPQQATTRSLQAAAHQIYGLNTHVASTAPWQHCAAAHNNTLGPLGQLPAHLEASPSPWGGIQPPEQWCCSRCCAYCPRWPGCWPAPAGPAWQRCSWTDRSYRRCPRPKRSWWFWPISRGDKSANTTAQERCQIGDRRWRRSKLLASPHHFPQL